MASTVQAFNSMLSNFLEELHQTFPEETKIAVVQEAFADLAAVNVRKPMELYTAALAPYAELVMGRNPTLFDQPIELPGGLDMSALWAKPDVSEETRAAMWQYIQMLFMLGTTVQNLPPQLLETIESVAASCAGQMQQEGNGNMDLSQLSRMLMGGLGNVLGSGGGGGAGGLGALGGLGGLLGGGGGDDDDDPLAVLQSAPQPAPGRAPTPASRRGGKRGSKPRRH